MSHIIGRYVWDGTTATDRHVIRRIYGFAIGDGETAKSRGGLGGGGEDVKDFSGHGWVQVTHGG